MEKDSRKADWIVVLFTSIGFVIVAWISNLEKALAAGVSLGVFVTIIQTKWDDSRNDRRFWLILSIFAFIHLVVISVVRFPRPRVSLISLPFALVDAFVMLGLINWVEKRFPLSRQ